MEKHCGNLVICFVIFGFLLLGCDGGSRIVGHVYDEDGKPIEKAKVVFEETEKGKPEDSYQSTGETGKDGKFDSMFLHSPFPTRLRLTVSKSGYITYQTEFTSSDAQKKLDDKEEYEVVLRKE